MRIRDIPYEVGFYWKGNKYRQIIRLKEMPRRCTVVCAIVGDMDGDWVDMPSGRLVKPVITLKSQERVTI